ncbi:4-hydroxy-2-oxoheptanedioate aldolase [Devosia sp. Root635]|uniref:4-hydroxy-2-oxoheptanedioate aldolase n=1 Tax=Devosia sp. Root635 TaxID=1736575 RepID=UPI0006F23DFC|nr:4-hydroxy-2-oxoheptanedioate aldolase [Devosia sp. Root635]KRA47213.1 2-keto-3-deoxy-L-rhamnonate aldolase [Devosia sp. Root635]
MPAPLNRFKAALKAGQPQIGLWAALANPYTAEILGGAGYDWLLLDAEHAPNDVPGLMAQLQALSASASSVIIRPPIGEAWIIKQLLDIGAQTLLVPMVESGAQAAELVRAMRYPPEGIRGVGAALARASGFNRTPDYLTTANQQTCLLVQVESRHGLDGLDDILAVDGVDGVFVGPADLAADLGYLGRPGAPEVVAVVEDTIRRIVAAGKPAGILTSDQGFARRCLDLGASFVAIGNDVTMLANAASKLLADFRAVAPTTGATRDPYA